MLALVVVPPFASCLHIATQNYHFVERSGSAQRLDPGDPAGRG